MTIDEWIEEYKPVPHPLGEEHGFEVSGKCCLIEPHESAVLGYLPRRHVWTLLEDDDGGLVIAAGIRKVNAMGFLQSAEPWESGDEATDPEEEEEEESDPDQDYWDNEDQDDD